MRHDVRRVLRAVSKVGVLFAFGAWAAGCVDPSSLRQALEDRKGRFAAESEEQEAGDSPEQDGGSNPALCDGPDQAKVKICHVPEGNPAARHTICVGLPGAINGHGVKFNPPGPGGHGGDYPGDCKTAPPAPQPAPSPQPSPSASPTPAVEPVGGT